MRLLLASLLIFCAISGIRSGVCLAAGENESEIIAVSVDNATAAEVDAINRAMEETFNKTLAALNLTTSKDDQVQIIESVE